jgi:predicted TIM-barrel fold metal-dependent hydrolase
MASGRDSDPGRSPSGRRGSVLRLLGLCLLGLAVAIIVLGGREPIASSPAPPAASGAPAPARGHQVPMLDMHVHLSPSAVPRLTALMNQYGIERIVNLSGGDPLTGLDQQLAAAATVPGKIIVFTTLAYVQAEYQDYGRRMTRLLEIAHERGARGLKIAKVLGLGLRDGQGRLIRVDDPALDPVFERAGELGMPVAIHTGDPEAFWLPVDDRNPRRAELEAHPGWALFGRAVPSFDQLLQQLETRIARHPRTTFISVHFGNAAERPEYVAKLLRKYPNLYIDTAARIPELGRHSAAQLQAFFLEFQDRILYGSDLGVGPEPTPLFLGSQGPSPPTAAERERFFNATRRYFETADVGFDHPTPIQGDWKITGIALPQHVLEKIYHDNAARLLGVPALH